jgi:hypothetical protein
MTDLSVQKVKKASKKLLKPAKEELEKAKSTAVKQVTGKDDSQTSTDQMSAVVEAMQQKSSTDGDDKKTDPRKHKSILEGQEDDEKKAKQKKKELEETMREIRDPEGDEIESKPGQPIDSVPMPTSKPSRGAPPGVSKSPERMKKRH